MTITARNVAVIGAGAAGLVTARELRREGHKVVVFEKDDQIGGTWVYSARVESDPLSLDPNRNVVHSSLYRSLRTNLPREVMGFKDFPFAIREDKGRDPRRFPGHKEVLLYLKDFVDKFGVEEMIRFETEVLNVKLEENGRNWRVKYRKKDDVSDEIFDAVVVAQGHYTEPRIAEIPGVKLWPGKQIHSHNYRTPEPFQDQVVILIGSSASAVDISREIAGFAKEVHIASRSVSGDAPERLPGYDNIWHHSMIVNANRDGSVVFHDGSSILADTILHCTGYKYDFPFLETNGIVAVDDNRVGPLYKHVFPPLLAPWLSFVGLPWKVVPFIMFELQSKWIAGVLSNRIMLPSKEDMLEDIRAFYSELEASGVPKRYTHCLGDSQFEYNNWFARQCGCPGYEEWREGMHRATTDRRKAQPETYRDKWEDYSLILQAQKDFIKNIL